MSDGYELSDDEKRDLIKLITEGKPLPEKYRFLLDVNPLGQLLAAWSDVINQGQAPTSHQLLVAAAWAFGFLVAGFLYFVSRERDFAVRL